MIAKVEDQMLQRKSKTQNFAIDYALTISQVSDKK